MSAKEVKFEIIQQLVSLDDMDLLLKIQRLLKGAFKTEKGSTPDDEDEFDASKMTFEEWSRQFTDERDAEDFLPEYNMTLQEFRRTIYEAEKSGSLTYEELGASIEAWKNE